MIFPKPAQNVFHVDNRVIHDFADGDCQSTEGQGIEADSETVQDNDRAQQGQRNCHHRNQCSPYVREEEEENNRDQNGANQ